MALKNPLPPPQITLTREEARRFILAHQFLLPPRSLSGKTGAVQILRRLGCIQFDPVNVVGWNPDLVLQARLGDYRAAMLDELLYTDRVFWDGFDKVQSIYLSEDWPSFARRRTHQVEHQRFTENEPQRLMPLILGRIRENGPLSSADLEESPKVNGYWGFPIRLERAALENLYLNGVIGIHHRVGTRRYFDLTEKLLPPEIYNTPEPHESEQAYHDWHVLRRIGSMGLAHPGAGQHWLGILNMMSGERSTALIRLIESGQVVHAAVDGVKGQSYMLRSCDFPLLEAGSSTNQTAPRVTFLAPLDNFLWQRDLLRRLFDFDYTWEVYTPAVKRKYGHYVLPVLYGDKFIARAELLYERKAKALVLRSWWWEAGITPDKAMETALADGLIHFVRYMEAGQLVLRDQAAEPAIFQRVAAEVNRSLAQAQ